MGDRSTNESMPPERAPHPPPASELSPSVLICLRIEAGEPMTGTLTTTAQPQAIPFCGWMDLIAAITAEREHHSG